MYMTAKQYHEQEHFPLKTIRRYCRRGVIPAIIVGRVYWIEHDEAKAILDSMKTKPAMPTTFEEGLARLEEVIRRKYAEAGS